MEIVEFCIWHINGYLQQLYTLDFFFSTLSSSLAQPEKY